MGKRSLPPFNWGRTEFIHCSVLRVDYQPGTCASLLTVCANGRSLSSTMDRSDIEKKVLIGIFLSNQLPQKHLKILLALGFSRQPIKDKQVMSPYNKSWQSYRKHKIVSNL